MPPFQEILSRVYLSLRKHGTRCPGTAKNDGFMVIKKSTDHNDENVIFKGTYKCYKSGVSGTRKAKGTAKTDCQFNVHFRRHQATGSYSFTDTYDLAHNHPMDPASTTISALARRFTPSQANLIDTLHSLNVPVTSIVEELRRATNAIVRKKDVYNNLQRSMRKRIDGQVQILDLLSALDGNEDFIYKVSADSKKLLNGLTFADRRSLAQFSFMSFVLLMDGTCKTNRYNMPLLIISSVDQFGSTYIVACCLMRDETIVSYRRALLSFRQLFGPAAPAIDVIVTDQESALMNAISEQFPNSHHQLCRWHLKENVKKNFKSNPLFCSHFSRLMMCNSEDLTYQMCYGMCESYSNKENAYLNRAYGLKEKFVEVWVSRYRNLEIRST